MAENTEGANRSYAVLQTVFLCAFAAAFFSNAGPQLFASHGMPGAVGLVLCMGGLLLLFAAFVSLGGAIQIAPEPRAGAQLVTKGIYARLRHPIYTAIIILVVGLFLRKPALLVAITGAATVAFLVVKVKFEERLLLERYPEYAEYRTRSWGIMPGL